MKKSTAMHWAAYLTGTLGPLALIGAWIAGENGTVLGLSQQHLYYDAIVLVLISISALLCALVYLKKGE